MNPLLLKRLVEDIRTSVDGGRIESIRHSTPLLVVALAGRSARRFLTVVTATPGPFCFYGDTDPLDGCGAEVLRRIYGARISGPPPVPQDRVIRIPLANTAEDHTLAIYLFGSAARVRLESGRTVIESLDPREAGRTLPESQTSRALNGGKAEAADDLRTGGAPFVLQTSGRLGAAVPLTTHDSDGQALQPTPDGLGPFPNAREACAAVGELIAQSARDTIRERLAAPIRKRLGARARLREKLEAESTAAEAFDIGRNEANVLAAFQSQIPAGASEIELPDLYTSGEKITIELDPSLTIDEQIKRRFKRASKLERSRAVLAARISEIDGEIASLRQILDEATHEATFRKAVCRLDDAIDRLRLRRPARTTSKTQEKSKQYRRFDLDPTWFVIVGRNNHENDEITFRVAAPGDIWLHAQQTAGSHVVLKSSGGQENPPATVLEAAAGIAAFYSKARHANLVPVIYTRRKYVRKFRGAKPGEVRCEREKTIFADPKLPREE